MIGYDFDKTILSCDSTFAFYKYCLSRNPSMWGNMFYQAGIGIAYTMGAMKKTVYKEKMFSFLKHVKNIDKMLEGFWKKYSKKVYPYYLRQRRQDDVIISASPEFLIQPLLNKINPTATLIASRVDPYTGKYDGLNCYGVEKKNRFIEVFGDIKLEAFYSDSLSDMPMFTQSEHQFIVKKGGQIERLNAFIKMFNGL